MESSLAYDPIEEYRDRQANISGYIRPDIRPVINTMYRDWQRANLRLMSLRDNQQTLPGMQLRQKLVEVRQTLFQIRVLRISFSEPRIIRM